MECRACSVSGWRCEAMGAGSKGAGTGQASNDAAPGMERMEAAEKLAQGRTWRTSHQKCLV